METCTVNWFCQHHMGMYTNEHAQITEAGLLAAFTKHADGGDPDEALFLTDFENLLSH